jgi:hypothetical protein
MCLNAILVDIAHISRAAMFCDAENTRIDAGALPAEFSEDTVYRGFVAFCKLDRAVPITNPLLLALAGDKPEDYAPQDDWPDKFRKLKSAHSAGGRSGAYTQEAFAKLLDEVNSTAKISGSGINSGSRTTSKSQFEEFRELLSSPAVTEHVNDHVDIMTEEMRDRLVSMLDAYDLRSGGSETEMSGEERDCYDMLSTENAKMFRDISGAIFQQSTATDAGADLVLEFIKTVDRFETEPGGAESARRRSLQCSGSDDAATVKCVQFIKNSIRFMMITVPGLLSTSSSSSSLAADNDNVNVPKHWKLSESHGDDISKLVNRQYTGLGEFCDDPQLKTCVSQMSASITKINVHESSNTAVGGDDGGNGDSLCSVIMRFLGAIPFIANGQSVVSGRIVRQLYKYFFLRVVKIYAYFITTPTGKINVNVAIGAMRVAAPPTTSSTLMGTGSVSVSGLGASALLDPSRLTSPIQAEQDALSTRSSILRNAARTGTEKTRMRELLITILRLLLQNKREINKTVDQIMQATNRMKRRETEQMRSKFKLMTADQRGVSNELKNLRLGDWNVGSRKGFTQYDKATYDRESRERANEAEAETETFNDVAADAAAGVSALALVSTVYDAGFGPEQLDGASADAVIVDEVDDAYKLLRQSDGDEYDRDQAMRNESGITTTCY